MHISSIPFFATSSLVGLRCRLYLAILFFKGIHYFPDIYTHAHTGTFVHAYTDRHICIQILKCSNVTFKNLHEIKCEINSVLPEMEWGQKEKNQTPPQI